MKHTYTHKEHFILMIEIQKLIKRFPVLTDLNPQIGLATERLIKYAKNNGTIFTCCNGGSDADAEHIAGELIKSFTRKRPLPKTELNALESLGEAEAALAANPQKGAKTILLSGRDGGKLATICDVNIIVPEQETYIIQELHLPIYHAICLEVERQLFPEPTN